ncbi:hypothetical protein Tco_0956449 [Tanacetum coccineum]
MEVRLLVIFLPEFWDLLQTTIKEYYSVITMVLEGNEDALLAFQHEYGVCADTPILEDGGDDPTVGQVKKRNKWDNDDYVYRGLILNGMSDSLFDIYQNVESSKEL